DPPRMHKPSSPGSPQTLGLHRSESLNPPGADRFHGADTSGGDRGKRRFADALDQGRAYTLTGIRGQGGLAGTFDQGRASALRGEGRDNRLAGTINRRFTAPTRLLPVPSNRNATPEDLRAASVDDNAGALRHDPRQGGFAGTVDEHRAGPRAGHRRKSRLARPDDRRRLTPAYLLAVPGSRGAVPDDRRRLAPTRLLAVPSNRGAVPEGHRHQNIFTSSGTSFSPSHCIGVSGTSWVPSHSANCGPPTGGGSGPSPSGIAIVNDAWVVFAVNVPDAVSGDTPASVHICCVNRYDDVGWTVPTLVSACQPAPTVDNWFVWPPPAIQHTTKAGAVNDTSAAATADCAEVTCEAANASTRAAGFAGAASNSSTTIAHRPCVPSKDTCSSSPWLIGLVT